MIPRAIICDVYRTILEVLPPGVDVEEGWERLCRLTFGAAARMSFAQFNAACRARVEVIHAEARARGIAFPEVQWPRVTGAVLPELRGLNEEDQTAFTLSEQTLSRRLVLAPGAADALREWSQAAILLGIASNAQAYTGPELDAVLKTAGLGVGLFAPDLVLWSWQAGFSKPEPHFFQTLLARLEARGIDPGEALMVGDRTDNDIAPACSAGLAVWHLHPDGDGGWDALREAVRTGSVQAATSRPSRSIHRTA